ncbi:T9SS type A sorting domain-containing protein [Aureisphaera galaxeae]|uniref:T9SS type A sorting domain-containing protein n=1 Tax=Aureisphaera galaxeae TaxID=1538023 RepID=UPI00234FF121|nr:T9SS type A sorting domain-containing protein [Aureisphaera galaxeae]MDC8005176.1 T9SS type A sorting domain-containing protein [Aureisphaera galaxeae]
MKSNYTISFFLFFLSTGWLFAQDGTLDVSFGDAGIAELVDVDTNARSGGIALTENQNIIAVGNLYTGTETLNSVLKLNTDGTLDTSFGVDGYALIDFGTGGINRYIDVFIQDDGKIVTSGHVGSPNSDLVVSRFMSNGTLDTSFGDSGHAFIDVNDQDYFTGMVASNNSIFVVGYTSEPTTGPSILITKYDAEGILDPSYGNNGVVITDFNAANVWPLEAIIDSSGNLFVSLRMVGISPDPQQTQVLKYLPNGILDASFAENGTLVVDTNEDFTEGTIQLDAEGRLWVAYANDNGDIFYNPTFVSRYLENGELDQTYGYMGTAEVDFLGLIPDEIIIQTNGKVVLAGNLGGPEVGTSTFARLNPNGNVDISFGDGGSVSEQFEMGDALMQEDGKLLAFGYTWWFTNELDFIWARYNNDPLDIADFPLQKATLFPNPSSGIYTLQVESGLSQNIAYTVVDISGKIVQEGILTPSDSSIDIRNAQSGIYFLKTENTTFKFIKE